MQTRNNLSLQMAYTADTYLTTCSHIKTLLINLDNGPESHSRRTQFMQRLVEWVQHSHLTIRLAYDPPYPGKYNPIERGFGR